MKKKDKFVQKIILTDEDKRELVARSITEEYEKQTEHLKALWRDKELIDKISKGNMWTEHI